MISYHLSSYYYYYYCYYYYYYCAGVDESTGAAYLFSPRRIGDKKNDNAFWNIASDPEDQFLVLITILPLAALFIPIIVLSCVWYFNEHWHSIEKKAKIVLESAYRDQAESSEFDLTSHSSRALMSHSNHSTEVSADDQVNILYCDIFYPIESNLK